MEKSYRLVLSSGDAIALEHPSLDALRAAILDEKARWELYLVNEDGPYIVPAHVVSIEIVHGHGGVLSAEAVNVATMDVGELTSSPSLDPL